MDSHVDIINVSNKYTVIQFTPNVCRVMTYSDEYESVKAIQEVQCATGYTSTTGQCLNIILNKVLYFTNLGQTQRYLSQVRLYNIMLQDNSYDPNRMAIESLNIISFSNLFLTVLPSPLIHSVQHKMILRIFLMFLISSPRK